MTNDEVLRQVWPVFSAEAREILQNIGRRVLSLEAGDASAETHEAVQRDAHSLKGMSGSLGLEDLVVLAHAIEDRLVAARAAPALPHAVAEAILRALDAIEAALEASPAPGVVRVEAFAERLAQLRAAAAGSDPADPDAPAAAAPGASSAPVAEAAAPATPSPAPPAGGPPAAPPSAAPPARPAGPARAQDEGAIRVPARIIDQIGGTVEALSLVADAAERRAQALVAAGEGLQAAVMAARGAALGDPDALLPALDRLLELAREVGRHGLESQRDALRHKLETAAAREDLRQLRMVPLSLALEPLRRAARDAATALGKEVALHLDGGELRLDRRIVEAVKDPLVHLVRNAVDHGLEAAGVREAAGKRAAGRIDVRVAPRGHRVAIQVTDDGAGLSAERIRRRAVERDLLPAGEAARLPDAEVFRLAFTPGFSTAEQVTAISGRGVGLDVVQSTVTRLQGTIQVASTPGQGTTFELDLPLALSVTLGVLVRVEAARAAIPAEAVERVLRVRPEELGEIQGRRVATVAGKQLPFEELAEVLHVQDHLPPRDGAPRPALLLRLGESLLVLGIDEVLGERELVVRGLGRRGAGAPLLAGAALLEDGSIVSVLNPAMLLGRSQPRPAPPQAGVARIVVADDSLTSRTAVKTILEVAGYAVIAAADGEEAWRHLSRGGVDLVVTDCQMPRLDGLGLARRLKGDPALRATPLILVTSLDAPEDRRAGLEAGADAYVVKKDVQGGALLDLVRALLPARRG